MKTEATLSRTVAKKALLPLLMLGMLLAAYLIYRSQITPLITFRLQDEIRKLAGTVFFLTSGWLAHKILGAILEWYNAKVELKTFRQLDNQLLPIARRTIKIIVWTAVILMILPLYGINTSALIALLGVGSLAISLAAQDTIANIIAGFLLMIDRPFRLGDKIKLPSGETVKVLDVGIRRSKFLAEDGAIVIIPNLDLSKSKITNYTYARGTE